MSDIYLAQPLAMANPENEKTKLLEKFIDFIGDSANCINPFMIFPNLESAELKPVAAQSIFKANLDSMNASSLIFACIDDRDMGVSVEIGYAIAKGIPIISYSFEGYGSNIMIEQAVVSHIPNIKDMIENHPTILKAIIETNIK